MSSYYASSVFSILFSSSIIYSSTSGFAYDTMNHAMSPATPNAARIGTARMAGVPNNAPKRSDNTVVGSNVAAACSSDGEDDNAPACDNGDDAKISSIIGPADRFDVVRLENDDGGAAVAAVVGFPRVTTNVLDGDGPMKPITAVDGDRHDIIRPTKTITIDNMQDDEEKRLDGIIIMVVVVVAEGVVGSGVVVTGQSGWFLSYVDFRRKN